MLCLASCDKTAPGQLMAAARLNIPAIIVACGYQPSGTYRGRHCDIEDVFLAAGHVASGKVTVAELTEMRKLCAKTRARPVSAPDGTANTMHLACEALGLALPGSTPVRATASRCGSRRAGRPPHRRMTGEDLKPRDILTPAAFANAVTAILSVSGSINSVKHLQAVAAEADRADVYRFHPGRPGAAAGRGPPTGGPDRGVRGRRGPALLKQLEPLLDGGALTVTGRTLRRPRDRGRRGRHPSAGPGAGPAADDRADPG